MPGLDLIFANGDLNDGPAVRRALAHRFSAYVIAADGGARHAFALDIVPHVVVGDFDSLSESELASLAQQGAELRRHSPDKDETDLELALLVAIEHDCQSIRIIGAIGDRLDQTLGNVLLLALPGLQGRDVRLVGGKQTAWLARPGNVQIEGAPGDTLSLIPLGGPVSGITTKALKYPLQDETLTFGPARGISNVLEMDIAHIHFQNGFLLLIHTEGRA